MHATSVIPKSSRSPSALRFALFSLTSGAAVFAAAPLVHAQEFSAGVSVGASSNLSGLDSLVAPIALYPDPLVGIILPASTSPDDLQAAAGINDPNQADAQSWQPAVKDLAHYPQLVQWMAGNQDWTAQLGGAFAAQPDQVFGAIQDLRHRAVSAGVLQSNEQIVVVQTGGIVQILPRDINTVYIPQYDAESVFVNGHAGVSLTFGAALPAGDWLAFYPAWNQHAIYGGDWYAYSRSHGGWQQGAVGFAVSGRHSGVHGFKEYSVANRSAVEAKYRSAGGGHYAKPKAFGSADMNNGRVGYQNSQRNSQPYAQQNSQRNAQWQQQRATAPNRPSTFAGDSRATPQHSNNQEFDRTEDRNRTSGTQDTGSVDRNRSSSSGVTDQRQRDEASSTPERTETQRTEERSDRAPMNQNASSGNVGRDLSPGTGDHGRAEATPNGAGSASHSSATPKATGKQQQPSSTHTGSAETQGHTEQSHDRPSGAPSGS